MRECCQGGGVRGHHLAVLLIPIAAILAYANSYDNAFILDDYSTVLQSQSAHSHLWPLRFLVDLSFKLNWAIGRYNVADYHLVNLAIHVAAGLLLYGVVCRTLRKLWTDEGSAASTWVAAVAAAAWVVHPVQTESVTYICQRYESAMGMFYLLALYGFVRGATAEGRALPWYAVSVGACGLGMASKENMVTAPLMILLYDYVFLSAGWRDVVSRRGRIHAALLGTWGVLAGLAVKRMVLNASLGVSTMGGIPVGEYLATQFGVVVHYLKLSVFPRTLCLDYSWPPAMAWWPDILLPAAIIMVLLALTVWAVSRRLAAGYLGAWFFIVLAPVSSVVPMGDMAFEHRLYLPLAAPVCLAVGGGYVALRALMARAGIGMAVRGGVYGSVGGLMLVTLGTLTAMRNVDYRSELAMWQDVVEKRPMNCRAQIAVTAALLKGGQFEEAEKVGRRLLGTTVIMEQGTGAYRLSPVMARHYRQAALNSLGQALLGQRKVGEAEACFRQALEAGGGIKSSYHLAQVLYLQGRDQEAMVICDSVIAGDPRFPEGHVLKGFLLRRLGQNAAAVACFRAAVAADPGHLAARWQLAWLLATSADDAVRNGKEALGIAKEVYRETGGHSWMALDALAAASAETGDFQAAVRLSEAAITMGASRLDRHPAAVGVAAKADEVAYLAGRESVTGMAGRVELYRQGKPYRE